jgi:hypothetical protein
MGVCGRDRICQFRRGPSDLAGACPALLMGKMLWIIGALLTVIPCVHCIQAELRKLCIDRPSEHLLVMDDYRLGDRDGLGYMGEVGSVGILQTG